MGEDEKYQMVEIVAKIGMSIESIDKNDGM